MAEEVVVGLKLALETVDRVKRPDLNPAERRVHSRELHRALEIFIRFIADVQQTPFTPVLSPGSEILEVNRLGALLTGEYALFEGPITLEPGQYYPINYCAEHWVSPDQVRRDSLEGSDEATQWYFGYADPDIKHMDGYAISVSYFLAATEKDARLGAIEKDQL